MKNLIAILFVAILFSSCSKKEDPKPEPVKTWIMGKWVRVAQTGSTFSDYKELYFDTHISGRCIDNDNLVGNFQYSLTTMQYTGSTGNKWQINKITDTQLSIGTPGATILTYYNKK